MYKVEELPLLKCGSGFKRLTKKQLNILSIIFSYEVVCKFTYEEASQRIGAIIEKSKKKNFRFSSWEEVMYIEGAEPFDR